MKKIIFILAVISGLGYMPKATAQGTKHIIPGVSVRKFNMGRNGKYLTVEMNVDLTVLLLYKKQDRRYPRRERNGVPGFGETGQRAIQRSRHL